ncbi:MAG: oxygenase MpaB family protein [Archangium sp.]|nr:oxygenase MpaB family protein [Archangium sp.]
MAQLGAALLRADPLADAVVSEAFRKLQPGRGWAQVQRALDRGIASVPDAHPAIAALFTQVEQVPSFVDWEVLDRAGALLLRTGYFGGLVLGLYSLPYGYASPAGNKPLALSGRLIEQAPRRLFETARFVHAACLPGALLRGGEAFKIAVKVRLMHAQVRRLLWDSGRWSRDAWGEPINQHDMSATTLLFSLVVLDGIRKLGFRVTTREAEDYTQLWRYVGWLMGAELELLPSTEVEAVRLAQLIMATQGEPDEDARALTRALLGVGGQAAHGDFERRRAAVARYFTRVVAHRLLGRELAVKLGVPRSPLEPLFPLVRGGIGAAERVRGFSSRAHRFAVSLGNRYWEQLIETGLEGKPAEFGPPPRLSTRPAS